MTIWDVVNTKTEMTTVSQSCSRDDMREWWCNGLLSVPVVGLCIINDAPWKRSSLEEQRTPPKNHSRGNVGRRDRLSDLWSWWEQYQELRPQSQEYFPREFWEILLSCRGRQYWHRISRQSLGFYFTCWQNEIFYLKHSLLAITYRSQI